MAAGNVFRFENLGLGDIHRLLHPESSLHHHCFPHGCDDHHCQPALISIGEDEWEKPTLECLSPMPEADSRAA